VTRCATIADAATRFSVSTGTVSRVLAGVGRSRPETRSRVRPNAHRPTGPHRRVTGSVVEMRVVEMRGLEPLTPAMRTRCSSS
jgi:hypothetical protein